MSKWYNNLKEGDKVYLLSQESSAPIIMGVEGFYRGMPVIDNKIFLLDESNDTLYSGPYQILELTEGLKKEFSLLLARSELQNIPMYEYHYLYTEEEIRSIIDIHNKAVSRSK